MTLSPSHAKALDAAGRRARSAREAADRLAAKRDELIRAAAAAGATTREIGEAVGLSHVAVGKIAKRDQ